MNLKKRKRESKQTNKPTNKQTRCSCGISERKRETSCRESHAVPYISGQLIIGFVSPCYRELKSLSVCTRTQESYRLAAGGHSGGAGRCHTRDFIGFVFTEEWTGQRSGLVQKHCTAALGPDQRRRAGRREILSRLTSCPCLTDA